MKWRETNIWNNRYKIYKKGILMSCREWNNNINKIWKKLSSNFIKNVINYK